LFSKKSANFSIGKDSASESRTKLASVMPSAACLRDFNRKSKNKKNAPDALERFGNGNGKMRMV
jgi:hypothetical protein